MKALGWITLTIAGIILAIGSITYFGNLKGVGPATEGVETRKPILFGTGGTNPVTYATGRHFIWPSSQFDRVSLKPFSYNENFIDINASDNVPIDFKATFVMQPRAGRTASIVSKFGLEWYKRRVQAKFQTLTRNEVKRKTSIDLRTKPATIEESQAALKLAGQNYLDEVGIEVDLSQVQIGKIVPPEELLKEAAKTAAQKQRKKTQDARTLAENARKGAEAASAVADSEYMTKMAMTPDQYLRSRQLDILANAQKDKNASFNVWISSGATTPTPVIAVQ